jgi:hypothetical protein
MQHMQHVPTAYRDAVDGSDHRLGHIANQLVQVADFEHAALGRPVVAGLGALLDVAAGAEGLIARAGEDDRRHPGIGPRGAKRFHQLLDRLAAKGVVALGPIDRDDCGGLVDLIADVFVAGQGDSSVRR